MKRLEVTVTCTAEYQSYIDVPDEMTLEDAAEYANDHIAELCILSELEYVGDSDQPLTEADCRFAKTAIYAGTIDENIGLPKFASIYFGVDEDREIENILSDEYGFCISGIEEISEFDGGAVVDGVQWDTSE